MTWYCITGGGYVLKELRQKAGLTQIQLAEKSGVNVRQIRRVESGTSRMENVTLINAIRLADALNVPVEALIDAKEDSP